MYFGSDPGLESDLDALATAVEALQTALNSAATAAEVAELQTALEAAQADISTILENNNVYTGDVNITNTAELAFATALGDKVAIINGDVSVVISSSNGLTATAVNDVTSKIVSVVGSVTVTTTTDIDFSSLTSVSSAYTVSGKDINDSALKTAGSVSLSYTGVYSQPALTTAGSVTLETTTVTTTTAVDFTGLTSGNINGGTLSLDSATSVKIGAGAAIVSLTAPKALEVELHNAGTLNSLAINTVSATSVVVKAAKVTGSATVTATGDINLMAATEIGGAVTVNTAGDFSAAALTKITGASTITAANVTAPALKTLTGAATVNKVAELSLPALTTVSGGLTAANLITLNAPVLAATSTITTASATTMVIKNASNTHVSAGSLENLTIKDLATTFDASSLTKLKTLNVTGKASTSNGVTLTSANTAITSVSVDGELDAVSITGTGSSTTDKLTSVTTAGKIDSFTLDNSDTITSLNLGHAHIAGGAGSVVVITNNAKLASLTTSTDFMKTLTVTGNPMLTSFDGSSYVTVVNGATTVALTLHSNKLTGLFTEAVAATGTTDYKEAVIASDDLSTIKSYVAAVESATATLTLSVDLSDVNAATGAQTLSSKMYANEGVSTVIVSATSTTTLDSAAEFALVTNE